MVLLSKFKLRRRAAERICHQKGVSGTRPGLKIDSKFVSWRKALGAQLIAVPEGIYADQGMLRYLTAINFN